MKEGNTLEAVKPIISQMRTTNSAPWWHHEEGAEFLVTKPSAKARHQEEIILTHKSKHSSLQSPIYVFQCQNSKYFSPMVCRSGRSPAQPRPPAEQPSTRPESKQDMAGANTNTVPPSLCHPAQAIHALQHCTFLLKLENYTEKSDVACLNRTLKVAERFYC